MKSTRENPTARQSRKMLINALLTLMKDKTLKSTSIKDITEEADLSRRTFYRHYSTKEDILSDCFEMLFLDYVNHLENETSLTLPEITKVFFTFWTKHLDTLRILINNELGHLILKQMNESIPIIYEKFKGHLNEFENHETLKYALAFSTGGHYNMLMEWAKDGAKKRAF